jgi:predicted HicB family RNase H-like nuclease
MAGLKAKTTRRRSDELERALEEAGKEETVRLNANIPQSLHRQAKVKAIGEGQNLTDVVVALLREYVSR